MYQDNMSAMLLEKNGKKYSTKNTKHINVRYYFIKDWVETGDVVIEYCLTEKMLGGHFKNPLQGELFRKFRAEIMNIPDDLDMGEMGVDGKGLKMGSRVNCIMRLVLDAHRSVLGVVEKQEGKIVLWRAQISEHVKVRTIPLNWRKERSHGRLGATMTLLGNMCRRH